MRFPPVRLWLYKFRNFDRALERYVDMIKVAEQNREAIEIWQRFALGEARNTYAILLSWRIAMDAPDVDIHETVDAMIDEYKDQIARLEEQIVA